MNTDATLIWNLILTLGGGSFLYWMRGMSSQINDMRRRLADTREEVAKTYVTKIEVQEDMKEILNRFDRMEEKFDRFIASKIA
tara:strand:- start:2077 stop:2325 length:249 start_codon:yes stop_codon:yes gene_type:complete